MLAIKKKLSCCSKAKPGYFRARASYNQNRTPIIENESVPPLNNSAISFPDLDEIEDK